MKNYKVVTQKKGKYCQKILTWQFKGKQQRQNIPKPLWYLIDEPLTLEEFLSALTHYQKDKQPRQRKSDRRVKGEGSGSVRRIDCCYRGRHGRTKYYEQHWFDYELDGKKSSKYIPKAMVDEIMDLNVRKVPVSLILKLLD